MINPGSVIEFNRVKQFTYLEPIGSGGAGDTHLFKDETTDMLFAFKKFVPKQEEYKEEIYRRFVDEIKILFTISHPNIVRIYNYYLYPVSLHGYIQMEYINGKTIAEFEPSEDKKWEDIFIELISAFEYLESNNILHRDIRETNILIDLNGNPKVIDFGFGKQLKEDDKEGESVILNWPVTELPDEIVINKKYNHQSEIFFLGSLLKKLITEFKFSHIVDKMCKKNPEYRYNSFHEIILEITNGSLTYDFDQNEKNIYLKIAELLSECISMHINSFEPISDPQIVSNNLSNLINNCLLEDLVQNNSLFISSFISNNYSYFKHIEVQTEDIIQFFNMFNSLNYNKKKIVLNNIEARLSAKDIKFEHGDLPF